ncbi:MAG TPA: DMT family transporter [Aggregicoccus sp.]|nr:DMT family transporter [Aggregicoccus sp.]
MTHFLMVVTAAVLWGCWSLFLRPSGLSGPQCAFVAMAVMSLPAPLLWRQWARADGRARRALVLLGLADTGNLILYFAAVQRGPVSVAVLTHYLAPLLVALSAPWLLGERRSARALLAAPLTLGGLALVLGGRGGFSLETALLGGGSALFFAAIILCSKDAARAFTPLAVTALHAPLSALGVLAVYGGEALPGALGPGVALVVLGSGVCGALGNTLFNRGLRHVSTSAAGALIYLEPLAASAVGWAVFGEALGPWGLLGGMLVLGAGAWVAAERPAAPRLQLYAGS